MSSGLLNCPATSTSNLATSSGCVIAWGGENHQRTIHAGVVHANGDRVVIALRRGVADDVDRVVVRPGSRQHLVEPLDGGGREAGNAHAKIHRLVDGHHAGSAAVGDDGQTLPLYL